MVPDTAVFQVNKNFNLNLQHHRYTVTWPLANINDDLQQAEHCLTHQIVVHKNRYRDMNGRTHVQMDKQTLSISVKLFTDS